MWKDPVSASREDWASTDELMALHLLVIGTDGYCISKSDGKLIPRSAFSARWRHVICSRKPLPYHRRLSFGPKVTLTSSEHELAELVPRLLNSPAQDGTLIGLRQSRSQDLSEQEGLRSRTCTGSPLGSPTIAISGRL